MCQRKVHPPINEPKTVTSPFEKYRVVENYNTQDMKKLIHYTLGFITCVLFVMLFAVSEEITLGFLIGKIITIISFAVFANLFYENGVRQGFIEEED